MRAWIISDVHASPSDLNPVAITIPKADICVFAGDASGFFEQGIDFLKRVISPAMPVVAVLGNHDFYGNSIKNVLAAARAQTADTNIRYLENEVLHLDTLRIIGATLWTDFEILWGGDDEIRNIEERRASAIKLCRRYMLDFREIFRSDAFPDGMPGLVTSRELIERHAESRAFIEAELKKDWSGTTLVLTHHAPSPRSLLPRFTGHPSNAAFASDMTSVIKEGKPDYWVHGHIHEAADYYEYDTRVICNPRGYHHERGVNRYRPGFVIEL
ncbi:metallophosphoesterase [Rhizobium sp.]|uniref:metallophosphoesterase n=1 Tax=Rhizobium sp. TaxID=391 RepID=UPI00289B3380